MKKKVICAFIFILILIMCYPVVFLLTGSFMGENELNEKIGILFNIGEKRYVTWSLLPDHPNVWSFIKILLDSPEFFVAFWNTIKIAIIALALQCAVNLPSAWGLAIYNFPGRKILLKLYLVLWILPFQILMLPQYIILDKLSLLDTIWAVVLPMVFSPQFVLILYYFFSKIPGSVFDAARLEGANEMSVFIHVGIPLCKPGFPAAGVLSIVECFNVIEQPILFLKTKELWPLSMYLPNARLEKIGENFVAAVINVIPVILLYLYGICCTDNEYIR